MMLHKYSQIEYSIRRKTTCIIYYQDYANSLTNNHSKFHCCLMALSHTFELTLYVYRLKFIQSCLIRPFTDQSIYKNVSADFQS